MSIDQVIGADSCDWPNAFLVGRNIDDAGLSPRAFRVLAHLARRANGENKAYPGLTSITKTCRMRRIKVLEAIRELESRGCIIVERHSGTLNQYLLLKAEFWKPEPVAQAIPVSKGIPVQPVSQSNHTSSRKGTGPVSQSNHTSPTSDTVRIPKKDSQYLRLSLPRPKIKTLTLRCLIRKKNGGGKRSSAPLPVSAPLFGKSRTKIF